MMAAQLLRGRFRERALRAGSRWGAATRRAVRNELGLALRTTAGRIGLPLVLLYLTLALIGSWLAPYSAAEQHLDRQLEAPSWQFWLGTDQFGRDILSRVMSGAGSIISMSVAGAA